MQARQPTTPETPVTTGVATGPPTSARARLRRVPRERPSRQVRQGPLNAPYASQWLLPLGALLHHVGVGTLHAEDRQATDDGCSVAWRSDHERRPGQVTHRAGPGQQARYRSRLCGRRSLCANADQVIEKAGSCNASCVAGSDHHRHVALGRHLHRYLHWRDANTRHPDALAARRRERARVRSQRQHRWGLPTTKAA